MPDRPLVPEPLVRWLGAVLTALPDCREESAWVGTRWRVRSATVAHVFGGEDQLVRITFRAEPDEVAAFEHLGPPYFRSGWGRNVVGLVLGPADADWSALDAGGIRGEVDHGVDWDEVRELLTDSYCLQAPRALAERVPRPPPPG